MSHHDVSGTLTFSEERRGVSDVGIEVDRRRSNGGRVRAGYEVEDARQIELSRMVSEVKARLPSGGGATDRRLHLPRIIHHLVSAALN